MSRWKRLSVRDFKFTKVSVVYRFIDEGTRQVDTYSDPCISYCVWDGLTLYTNEEGVYRLRRNGELLCEGDEFLLACIVARLKNDKYKERGYSDRAFVIDGDLS